MRLRPRAESRQILDHYRNNWGIHLGGAVHLLPPNHRPDDIELTRDAMSEVSRAIGLPAGMGLDAQPQLITVANAGVPAFLTMIQDPEILKILTAKNAATEIFDERRKGDWTTESMYFSVIEYAGAISAYGDFNRLGRATANTNFPWRQSFLYQIIIEYGELEMDREALAKINWANELRNAAVAILDKMQNLGYLRGIVGLQNYGLQNDPALSPAIAPALKAWGGTSWFNGLVVAATANEIFSDLQTLLTLLVNAANGNIDPERDEVTLVMSPKTKMALTTTNSFGVNVHALLKENFPKLKIVPSIQYGAITASNPQGFGAGEMVQAIAPKVMNQDTGWMGFNEKLRAHRVVPDLSSFVQKFTQGIWGSIIRQPFAVQQLVGV